MRGNSGHGMLSTLRAKFVALNMACVTVVVVVSFAVVCYSEYRQDAAEVYQSIESSIDATVQADVRGMGSFLLDEGATLPLNNGTADANSQNEQAMGQKSSNREALGQGNAAPTEGSAGEDDAQASSGASRTAANQDDDSSGQSDNISGQSDDNRPAAPRIGGGQGQTIPVAVYTISDENAQATASPFATADIDETVLASACERLAQTDDGSGLLADLGLFYQKSTKSSITYIAFADINSAAGWQSLAWTLTGVGIIVIAVFFIISVFFARWALEPVQRAWQSQRQFIADASHELKTPLTVILADASIALEKPQATIESQRKWIEGIQAEGTRMRGLVEDMLALARHDAAASDADAKASGETFDLAEVARRCVLQFEAVAFERGVEISDACETAEVRGSSSEMQRVVGVLLDNACKYAGSNQASQAGCEGAPSSPDRRVSVRVAREGKHAVLRVSNTGEPISQADAERIFDRFWRADEARTGGKGGFGLGLAIAKSIVEEHGGKLEVSSEGGLTTFTATLPLAK